MNSIQAQKQLTDRELIIFNSELDRKRKSTAIAYVLFFFLGTIGGHKFYIGRPLAGLLYIALLLSGLFLLLPLGLLGILLLIDLFTIPGQIRKQEDCVRAHLLTRLLSSKA